VTTGVLNYKIVIMIIDHCIKRKWFPVILLCSALSHVSSGVSLWVNVDVLRSPAAVDGRIGVGDVIVEVNTVSLESMSDETAVNTLRDAVRNAT